MSESPNSPSSPWEERIRTMRDDEIRLPNTPFHTYMAEASDAANFIDTYWDADTAAGTPGLSQVQRRLPRATATEIRDLVRMAQEAQTEVLFNPDTKQDQRKKAVRAQKLHDALEAAIDFVLDDGVQTSLDQSFAEARQRLEQTDSTSALAQRLADYARLAQDLGDRMQDTGDFDPEWITEARSLASELLGHGAAQSGKPTNQRVGRRDRIMTILNDLVTQVRKNASYVFRDFPEIRRKAVSPYERRRHAEFRRRTASEG